MNFSYCQLITHLPDLSGVPNLRELWLACCDNLTVVHHSVGFLKMLTHLSVHACPKLKDFPPRLLLPSLQSLNLCSTSIAFFPDIEKGMDKLLQITVESGQIKELPDSVGNLTRLKRIFITSKGLRGITSALFMLPKIVEIQLRSCINVGESFTRFRSYHDNIATTGCFNVNKPRYSPLRRLHCSNCNLTDEDLHIILGVLPNLEKLSVPGNKFVSLPANIKESDKLRVLDVSHCKKLKKIPKLPSSIQEVEARDCSSLSSEALSMLWSQAFNEVYKLRVVVKLDWTFEENNRFPYWFDQRRQGGTVSFWARGKFPAIAVAFIFTKYSKSKFRLYINGNNALHVRQHNFSPSVEMYHGLLFDLRNLIHAEEYPTLDTFLVNEWNYVEIKCEDKRSRVISHCGAYVYRKETNIEDIRFENPNRCYEFSSVLEWKTAATHLRKLVHLTHIDFSHHDFITHFPDVSGVSNLRKLNLEFCVNLIAIHHSVGFLEKLEHLNADGCAKLEDFPSRMWLPSLQYLKLCDTNIAFFPDIEKRMDKPLTISLGYNDRIKELPDSVGNLMGLERIRAECCKSLRGLPSALFMLPAIEQLTLEWCPQVGGSFTRFLNSHVAATPGHSNLYKPRYSPLRRLFCTDCGLTDEDLHAIVSCFPNLEELYVSWNGFGALPIGIKESAKLKSLQISHCKNLKEIPELPSSLRKIIANNCPSLSSKASSILWSQALNEVYGLEVTMPQTPIPDWFDHRREGNILSLWARGKCPAFVVAFIRKNWFITSRGTIQLFINGVYACGYDVYWDDDALLIDIRHLFFDELGERPNLAPFLVSEWNYVKLQYKELDERDDDEAREGICCGAYVYKKKTNMEDIRFKRPNPSVKKLKIETTSNHNGKARRGLTHFQTRGYPRRRMKMVFPMTKFSWRFLSNGEFTRRTSFHF